MSLSSAALAAACLLHLAAVEPDGGVLPVVDATELLEAVKVLPEVPAVPSVSDMATLETAARLVLGAHEKLLAVVPEGLPEAGAMSELVSARQQAVSAARKLRSSFGQTTTAPHLETVTGCLNAVVNADRALSAELRSLTDKLQPTAVVVSGGVSLGSYQAGLLYYYSQYLVQHRIAVSQLSRPLAEEPMVATGASAGSVNAFLAAIATCRKPVSKPEDSFFWRVWMPLGFEGLLKLEDVTTYSLLSRGPLDAAVRVVAADWNDGRWQDEPCRLNIGLTVTREIPRSVPLNTNQGSIAAQVRLPIQTERVILTLEGKGGQSPGIRSVVPHSRGRTDPSGRLDFFVDWNVRTEEGADFPAGVAHLLQASSAFPLAWPPVMLETNGPPSHAYFLDGGLFDNNPVRLATRLLEWTGPGERKASVAQTRLRTQTQSRLLYVEPDATVWQPELVEEVDRRSSFSAMYGQLTMNLVGTARRAELLSTMEYDESDTLRDRIDVPLRQWPITGAFMLNFFAFLEEDFRRFDFYSGMADAADFLSQRSGVQRLGLENVKIESPELECVLAFRRGGGETPAKDLWACKYLFMVGGDQAQRRHATNLLALLDTSAEVRASIFKCIKEKSCRSGAEFKTLSAALPKHGFVFSDPALEGSSVIAAVRERLQPILTEFARRQPFPESAALAIGGKAALDSISVRPSRWYLGVGMLSRSGAELEYSRRVAVAWRPLTFGLRVLRLQSRFLVELREVAEERLSGTVEGYWHPLTAEGGFQWLTPSWPWWLRLGVSAGVGAEVTTLDLTPATYRFPASAALTLSLFQRAYVRFAVKQYPFDSCPNLPCGIFSEAHRADSVQLAGNRGDWIMSVGWRWID